MSDSTCSEKEESAGEGRVKLVVL